MFHFQKKLVCVQERMGFFRNRTNPNTGRVYTTYEWRWREGDKVRCGSRTVKSVSVAGINREAARKDATERYRDTLRENVRIYGRAKSGERYEAEARAREAYLAHLDAEQRGEVYVQLTPEEHLKDVRAEFDHLGKASEAAPSPAAKSEAEYMANRDTVRAEDRRLDAEAKETVEAPDKGSPTDEEEAMHAQWSDNIAADRDEMAAEYDSTESGPEAEAEPEAEI
jgi:hypothetical protein